MPRINCPDDKRELKSVYAREENGSYILTGYSFCPDCEKVFRISVQSVQ